MGIFHIFTNDAAKKAAEANRQLYSQYGSEARGYLGAYGNTANSGKLAISLRWSGRAPQRASNASR